MIAEKVINNKMLKVVKDDITNLDIDCFVYYATSDLKLGSGFGGAITVRGGPGIQKELDELGPIKIGQAIISSAGELKAKSIIHANGPKFQEEDTPGKLKTTIINSLKLADEKGIKKIAFPPMGTGFYGVLLPESAAITTSTIKEYLEGDTGLEEVVISVIDKREFLPFEAKLNELN